MSGASHASHVGCCTKCCEVLPRTAFSKDKREKNGIRARCKKCVSIADKKYYNSPSRLETKARYSKSEKGRQTSTLYEKSEKRKQSYARYRKSEKRAQTRTDPAYRITQRLRERFRYALKRAVDGVLPQKSNKTLELLGCSIEYFMKHMEQQFKPGMTWERFEEFHIDHIKPCAAFDLRDPEQQKICFHYSNMQPLWAAENLKKGAKF